ncbi:hypothetical protein [Streptomyces californicus]|uniref:hypothetical protein n=1 Tax=Streptomyces californicus TaxID=67351 RepID=UPI0004BFB4FC|nr:hypothetical protein [Streptomyces californicus]QRV56618.1 hypothetical protein I6J40_22280 [Streptomyces californicus]
MIVVYTPAGGEPEQYDAKSLVTSEASIVARTVDMKWPAIKAGLVDEDLDAMRGVVWVLKKRAEPTLRFGEFDPGVDEMVTRYDKDETEAWFDSAFHLVGVEPETTAERVATALHEAALDSVADLEHARAYIEKRRAEVEADEAAGKDPEPEANPEASAPARKTSAKKTSASSGASS